MTDASTSLDMLTELRKVAERAKREPAGRFHSLAHLIDVELLAGAFARLRNDAAVGVDGITKEHYGQELESKLKDLHERLRTKRYRHQPIQRVHIPKEKGRTRPIGISTIEDKVVQNALRTVLEAVYGAPGKVWRFQRVKIPHRQGEQPPHRESSLGLMEVTTRAKRRQSDGRAVTRSEAIEPREVVIRRPTES